MINEKERIGEEIIAVRINTITGKKKVFNSIPTRWQKIKKWCKKWQ